MLECDYQDIILCLVGAVASKVDPTNLTAKTGDKNEFTKKKKHYHPSDINCPLKCH